MMTLRRISNGICRGLTPINRGKGGFLAFLFFNNFLEYNRYMLNPDTLNKSSYEKILHNIIYAFTWPVMIVFGNGQRSFSFDWVKIPKDIYVNSLRMPASSIPVMERRVKGEGFRPKVMLNRLRVKFGGWKECVVIESSEADFYVGVDYGDHKEICRRKIKGTKVALMLGPGEVGVFAFSAKGDPVSLKRSGVYLIEKRPKQAPLY